MEKNVYPERGRRSYLIGQSRFCTGSFFVDVLPIMLATGKHMDLVGEEGGRTPAPYSRIRVFIASNSLPRLPNLL